MEILPKAKKKIEAKNGSLIVIGKIAEDIRWPDDEDEIMRSIVHYRLDSIFQIEILEKPEGAKIGNWIKIYGEIDFVLAKK